MRSKHWILNGERTAFKYTCMCCIVLLVEWWSAKDSERTFLVDFVDALYDVGHIFESPVVVQDKQFKFQPMNFPTKSPSLSKRTYEQWQKWFEETIEKQQVAA